jgi:hypothetical protein
MDAVIRPAAVLGVAAATEILRALQHNDVSAGGVWSATPGMWQRYDHPWDGPNGSRGTAALAGSIAVVYDEPRRNEITIYRVNVTPAGVDRGWTVERLCDDALSWVGLTLDTCPRAALAAAPRADPFHARVPEQRANLGSWPTSWSSATTSGAGG